MNIQIVLDVKNPCHNPIDPSCSDCMNIVNLLAKCSHDAPTTVSFSRPFQVCGVCWSSSWQPCEKDTPNAVEDPSTGGWMICGFCNEVDIANNLRNELDNAQGENDRMRSVLDELMKHNSIRNDWEAYHYVLCEWASKGFWMDGNDEKKYEKPDKKDYVRGE